MFVSFQKSSVVFIQKGTELMPLTNIRHPFAFTSAYLKENVPFIRVPPKITNECAGFSFEYCT